MQDEVQTEGAPGDKALVILQSLLCLMREKNLLSRCDIEELCERVEKRASPLANDPFPCLTNTARAAAIEMSSIGDFIGKKYGGKHRRR